jgi:hypothetical protein
MNPTTPVGVPLPEVTEETVATKATGCPTREGFGLEVSTVMVGLADEFTTWVSTELVLGSKLVSPLYVAVIA